MTSDDAFKISRIGSILWDFFLYFNLQYIVKAREEKWYISIKSDTARESGEEHSRRERLEYLKI